jgi:hypothetical protein
MKSSRQELDFLDTEIFGKAFDSTGKAIEANGEPSGFESDEGLEAALRRELIEIARFNGVSDPETLRDILSPRRADECSRDAAQAEPLSALSANDGAREEA